MTKIQQVLADPTASYWLKSSIKSALQRDIVDSLNDAEVLVQLLKEYINKGEYANQS